MNAEYVISSSFHCTVFSLIFNKQFCSIDLNDGNDNKEISIVNLTVQKDGNLFITNDAGEDS